ncbi:MAG: hypothetical protein FJX52_14955, partial [Alphaproteobacteria bacterium]|nr:hypothetical protein [Alphaproteobacteria bacterium]
MRNDKGGWHGRATDRRGITRRQIGRARRRNPCHRPRPVFSGEPGALERTAAELRRACTEVGFHRVKNHCVPAWIIARVHEEAARFHALQLDDKMKLKINADNIGYLPMRGNIGRASKIRDNKKPNLNESFIIKRDRGPDHPDVVAGKPFRGANKWPVDLPGFRETLVAYISPI